MDIPRTPPLECDIPAMFPDLVAKTTVRLHPRQGEARFDASKLGGPIAWPRDESWPQCPEHAADCVPVLQLRREDVPELGFKANANLFQLLWCPRGHGNDGLAPWPVVRWRHWRSEELVRAPPGVGSDAVAHYVPSPCRLFPERVTELPSAMEVDGQDLEARDEALRERAAADITRLGIPSDHPLYQYHFSVAPGTKVRGYVRWLQAPEVPRCACQREMAHLLTVASAEFDGSYQRWMPLSERDVWSGDYRARRAVQSAANLTMGNLYIFECTHCEGRRIAACR